MTTNMVVQLGRRMRTQSVLGDRRRLAGELNQTFKGGRQRDIYESAGYDKEIFYAQYLARYLRQDVARRVVNTPADESWRLPPELLDGTDPDSAKEDTEFTRAWQELANNRGEDGNTRRGLLHYLHRLDRISGIGRYGVLYLGIKDDKKPSEPAENASKGELLFASVFDEDSAGVATYDNNQQSARYGQPEMYRLVDRTDSGSKTTFEAHWTRCIHVADNPLSSDLVGSPRLEAVWNRLLDLEKVAAATGESGWRLMMPGYVFSTKDGYELGPDADNHSEQLDEFTHELRRWLELNGMEVQELAGTLQDPSGAVNVALKLISAGTGIPLRKLTGSEQGQLASGQDDDNWIDIIEARQAQHVTPAIIEPVVHRLTWLGVLPQPTNGGFSVWWPSLRKKDPKDVAQIADTTASALQKVQAKVKPRLFAETYLPDLPAEAVEEERKEPPPMPPAFGAPNNFPADGGQQPAQDGEQQDQAQPGAAGEGGLPAVNAGGFRWVVYP
jgi:uncharacterized protein